MANYRIEDIEGIGPAIGKKLREAGVKDTDTLLANAKSVVQRRKLAEVSGLSPQRILKYANMADLYRVNGIGSEYSELLEAAGVDTVPDLARRSPTNLVRKLAEVNEVKKLTRRVPTLPDVTRWVEQAKGLPRALTY